MRSIVEFLDCGDIYKNREVVYFKITKFLDLNEKVIPSFQKYQILGIKHLDFLDFVKVAEIMKEKGHLTAEGLSKIRKIKEGMNRGRKYSGQ